jgi:hypothetical protein
MDGSSGDFTATNGTNSLAWDASAVEQAMAISGNKHVVLAASALAGGGGQIFTRDSAGNNLFAVNYDSGGEGVMEVYDGAGTSTGIWHGTGYLRIGTSAIPGSPTLAVGDFVAHDATRSLLWDASDGSVTISTGGNQTVDIRHETSSPGGGTVTTKDLTGDPLVALSFTSGGNGSVAVYDSAGVPTAQLNGLGYLRVGDDNTAPTASHGFPGTFLVHAGANEMLYLGSANELTFRGGASAVGTSDATTFSLRQGGTDRLRLTTAGHLICVADDTYDIGSEDSGTTFRRPGTMWLGGAFNLGNAVGVSGVTNPGDILVVPNGLTGNHMAYVGSTGAMNLKATNHMSGRALAYNVHQNAGAPVFEARCMSATADDSAIIDLSRGRGTLAVDTNTGAADSVGKIHGNAWQSAGDGAIEVAGIEFRTDGTFTPSTTSPGLIQFRTTTAGSYNSLSTKWTINNAGTLSNVATPDGTNAVEIGSQSTTDDPPGLRIVSANSGAAIPSLNIIGTDETASTVQQGTRIIIAGGSNTAATLSNFIGGAPVQLRGGDSAGAGMGGSVDLIAGRGSTPSGSGESGFIGFWTGNTSTLRWSVSPDGHFLCGNEDQNGGNPDADNVYDIGSHDGGTDIPGHRPRTIYVGTSVEIGTVGGSTAAGDLQAGDNVRQFFFDASTNIQYNSEHLDPSSLTQLAGSHAIYLMADSADPTIRMRSTSTNGGSFVGEAANGTLDSPTALADTDHLISFAGAGYIGSTSGQRTMASIAMFVDGTVTDTSSNPGRIAFSTAADGSTTVTERWTINNAGHLLASATGKDIGSTTSAEKPRNVYVNSSVVVGDGETGTGTVSVGEEFGALAGIQHASAVVDFSVSGTATGLIPAGAMVVGVTTYTTGTISGGGATGYQVGDGTDVDRWGSITGLAIGTDSDPRDFTDNTLSFNNSASAADVVLTGLGGTPTAGTVRVVLSYLSLTAPTS